MKYHRIVSNFVVLSLIIPNLASAQTTTVFEQRQAEQLKASHSEQIKKLEKVVADNNSSIHKLQLVIERAGEYDIVQDPSLILGMNFSTIGAIASASVAAGAGAAVVIGDVADNKAAQVAFESANKMANELFDLLLKTKSIEGVFIDEGPAEYFKQTKFSELSQGVKSDVLSLLRAYGTQHSKQELYGMYKALQLPIPHRSYNPLTYLQEANETHWQSTLERIRLRAKLRYAAVAAGAIALVGLVPLWKTSVDRAKEKDLYSQKLEDFINKNDKQGAVDYINSCIAQVALLSAQNTVIEKQITSLK